MVRRRCASAFSNATGPARRGRPGHGGGSHQRADQSWLSRARRRNRSGGLAAARSHPATLMIVDRMLKG